MLNFQDCFVSMDCHSGKILHLNCKPRNDRPGASNLSSKWTAFNAACNDAGVSDAEHMGKVTACNDAGVSYVVHVG